MFAFLKKEGLNIQYTANIIGNMWYGKAIIPETYFPFKVTKWNAYAIHGNNENRVYEALNPVGYQQYKEPNLLV